MRVRRLTISNFRGVRGGCVDFLGHTLLVGGNNIGKSTVCEALDLVLGPERLFRRPVVDEHDFYNGKYLDDQGAPIEVRIHVVLLDLSQEATRRFGNHLRRWDDASGAFVDEDEDGLDRSDDPGVLWALPVVFVGRYDKDEDDFVGDTFFDHPAPEADLLDEETAGQLGHGRSPFTRPHKRLCGFVFLRALRTGSRALSLQRGSLLDAILKLNDLGAAEMWQHTLDTLQGLQPAIGDGERLKEIRAEVRSRMSRFVTLAPGDKSTAFFASNLTREHLREVVRLFIATQPGQHLLPFDRLGTGSLNLLVFALLTLIAKRKGERSVIFAMEEPEIALPPHTQRRVARFVLKEMGQSIVTSHSPYVIEQFDPEQIIILNRDDGGALTSQPIHAATVKRKTFLAQRRQFAEAVLSRAVLVVEGDTEAALFPVASSVMERSLGADSYTHFDLAGVTIFDADGDGAVPRYGPIFASLGKLTFAFYDKPKKALKAEALDSLKSYTKEWESPEKGIENLLVKETPMTVIRRFLDSVKDRPDYPPSSPPCDAAAADADVAELARKVLRERKGAAQAYAALLIEQCQSADELPATIRAILETINAALVAAPEDIVPEVVAEALVDRSEAPPG